MKKQSLLVACLLVVLLLIVTACTRRPDFAIWYGSSDQKAIMVAIEKDHKAVVVSTIPINIIEEYRQSLANEGKKSDTLGAIQHLFGQEGNHYFSGSAQQWDEVARLLMDFEGIPYQGVRPSVEAVTRLMIAHAGLLSKSEAIDTLGSLASVKTDAVDIAKVLEDLDDAEPLIRIYDTGRFLLRGGNFEHLRTYMNHWTELVLHEAKQNIGVEEHD